LCGVSAGACFATVIEVGSVLLCFPDSPLNIALPNTTHEKAMARIYGKKLPETPTKNICFYFVA